MSEPTTDALTPEQAREMAVLMLAADCVYGDDMNADQALAFARRLATACDTDPMWANGRHEGDCTRTAHSCIRCQVERYEASARAIYDEGLDSLDALAAELLTVTEALRDAANANPWTHASSIAEEACERLGIPLAAHGDTPEPEETNDD